MFRSLRPLRDFEMPLHRYTRLLNGQGIFRSLISQSEAFLTAVILFHVTLT